MPPRIHVQLAPALARRTRERPSPASAATAALLRRAGRAALTREAPSGELSITLLDDAAISEMNERWLAHTGPTDVISFPLYEAGEEVIGDVYIGYDQVLRQAHENDVPVREELARVVVHGTLHVLGHVHPDGRARLRSAMWRLQERIVKEVVA